MINTSMLAVLALVAAVLVAGTLWLGADRGYAVWPGIPASGHTEMARYAPLVKVDKNACLPASAVTREGQPNPGLAPFGGLTSGCRAASEAAAGMANAYGRTACQVVSSDTFCAHAFAYYFPKDQFSLISIPGIGGHRHDFEHLVVWTKNGAMTHASASSHGTLKTKALTDIPSPYRDQTFHAVYVKHNVRTHGFRFARTGESGNFDARNGFSTLAVVAWDALPVAARETLNTYDFGVASIKLKDSRVLNFLNGSGKPSDYPIFTAKAL